MVSNYDSEDYRKDLWENEYSKSKGLSSSKTYNPSSSLRKYLETYSKEKEIAVDIGSGNGRNSIYLSQKGFKKVLGIELSTYACNQAENEIKRLEIDNIEILNQSISKGIPIKDNSVDLVIDMMSMHAMNTKERDTLFSEVKRVLKPKGEFLIFTLATDSPASKDLIGKWKGSTTGSYRFEINKVVYSEKTFTKEELEQNLSPLKLKYFEQFQHNTQAFDNVYSRAYIHTIFQKE